MAEGARPAALEAQTASSAAPPKARRPRVEPRAKPRYAVTRGGSGKPGCPCDWVSIAVPTCCACRLRTVRTWEAGTSRVPYAAYKLLRVMRGGKLLGTDWRGFHVWRDTLVTPEGHKFRASELAWWSLQEDANPLPLVPQAA